MDDTLQANGRTDPAQVAWAPASGILSCSDGTTTVVLSLDRGRYYFLDTVGSSIWRCLALSGASVETIARVVVKQWDVPLAEAKEDVASLCVALLKRGLIREIPSCNTRVALSSGHSRNLRARPGELRPPLTFVACLWLAAAAVAVRTMGLGRIWKVLHRLPVCQPSSDFHVVRPLFAQTAERLNVAATLLPFPARCLEQSLCLMWLGRRCGIDVQLRLGVLPLPFQAHAWVELAGHPLNDTLEHLALYRLLEGDVDYAR